MEIIYIILGALLALGGGFIQKRFDLKLDKENNDKDIMSEIIGLSSSYLQAKLKQQTGSEIDKKDFFELNSQMAKLSFQMKSKKYREIKLELIKSVADSIENFKFSEFENLQKKLEEILTN